MLTQFPRDLVGQSGFCGPNIFNDPCKFGGNMLTAPAGGADGGSVGNIPSGGWMTGDGDDGRTGRQVLLGGASY